MDEIECELKELRNTISKPGNDSEDLRIRKAMIVLLTAASEQSTDIPHLTERSGLPEEFVAGIADKMRAAGEWTEAGIDRRRCLYDDGRLRFLFLIDQALLALGEEGLRTYTEDTGAAGVGTTNTSNHREKATIVHALCVLAFATECGTNPESLAARSGIRIYLIRQIADRMRGAGLWTDDGVDQSEWSDASGEFNARAFFSQAQVAAGLARRTKTDVGYDYVPVAQESDGPATQPEQVL